MYNNFWICKKWTLTFKYVENEAHRANTRTEKYRQCIVKFLHQITNRGALEWEKQRTDTER